MLLECKLDQRLNNTQEERPNLLKPALHVPSVLSAGFVPVRGDCPARTPELGVEGKIAAVAVDAGSVAGKWKGCTLAGVDGVAPAAAADIETGDCTRAGVVDDVAPAAAADIETGGCTLADLDDAAAAAADTAIVGCIHAEPVELDVVRKR